MAMANTIAAITNATTTNIMMRLMISATSFALRAGLVSPATLHNGAKYARLQGLTQLRRISVPRSS